jgi:tRNA pseudouridine55 synthase
MYFLSINKPKNITSFDVIRFLRKKLKIKQIGHSGTLDPLATGVMQVAVGKATKLLDYLDSDKTYIAKLKFGYTTQTYDSEGEEVFVKKPDFKKEDLENIIKDFIGKTLQTPPKFSAIKINGKKLCDIARKQPQQEIEIKKREIEIYSIDILDFDPTLYTAILKVHCKKGTYIRALANDIGKKLTCGAYLTELTRTQAGNFNIGNSSNLEDEFYNKIDPLDCLNIEQYELNEEELSKIKNGMGIKNTKNFKNNLLLLTKNNKLLAVANVDFDTIKPKKYFGE